MNVMLSAQVFAPHAASTTKAILILAGAAILIFRQHLLPALVYGILILFTIALVVGVVTLAQL
jgi:hypothetical protein